MSTRETIFYDIPQEWRENAKKGLCPVCGKHRAEFQKFMRVYCSPEHRDEYNARIYTWASFREKVLETRGKKCEKCGRDEKAILEGEKQEAVRKLNEWAQNHQAEIELKRTKLLEQVEEDYRNAMDDAYVINQAAPWEIRKGSVFVTSTHAFEVDHIQAIVNGGEMFDWDNVQVLCRECHVEKTTQDMRQKRNTQRKQATLKPAEVPQ